MHMQHSTALALMVTGFLALGSGCTRNAMDDDVTEIEPVGGRGNETPDADRGRRMGGELTAQDFISRAVSMGMFEVQSAQLAQEKTLPSEYQQLTQRLINDHTRANETLKALAQSKGWRVSGDLLPQQQQTMSTLRGANESFAEDFDRAQTEAHQEAIELFERCARECDDPSLRTFASRNVSMLEEHLRVLRDLSPGETGDASDSAMQR